MDEDNIIGIFLQNKYLVAMQIYGLKEEPLGKPEDRPWEELIIVGFNQDNLKIIVINPSQTLKIIPFLSTYQEEKLLTILMQKFDVFTWDYKEMKGIHPLVYTHHIYIK